MRAGSADPGRAVRVHPRAIALALSVATALAAGVPVRAQEARVRVEADTSLITVGDRVTLVVTVEHDADQSVTWPDSVDVSPFEVLGAEALPPAAVGGRVRTSVRMTLTAFELGDLVIPGIPIVVASPDGATDTLVSDDWGVTVSSVGLDQEGDIRGIRGPLSIPFDVVFVLPWLLVAAAAIALFVWWWLRRKRGREPEVVAAPTPSRPPFELALEALARLEASDLLQRGEVKEYHVRASDIVRTYVEDFYRVPALEMTTGEVLVGLRRVGVDGAPVEHLERFLARCDLVKFAKMRPSADDSRAMLALARDFVEETRTRVGDRPEVEAPAAPEVGGIG